MLYYLEKESPILVWIVDVCDNPVACVFKGSGHRWYIMDKWKEHYLATAEYKRDILPAFSLYKTISGLA